MKRKKQNVRVSKGGRMKGYTMVHIENTDEKEELQEKKVGWQLKIKNR